MTRQRRRPRLGRHFTVALAIAAVLGAGAIGVTSGRGDITSPVAGRRQVGHAAAGELHSRSVHITKRASRPSPSRPVPGDLRPAGHATGHLRPRTLGHKPFGTTPGGAGPLVAEINSSRALLEIPAIGVRAPLVPTGADGAPGTASLVVPGNIHTVAWWDGSVLDGDRVVHENAPSPGQPGVAVIAGHIDSAFAGPGALYDLKDLDQGDTIKIVDSLGRISTWTVSAQPETALKSELPSALWVSSGPPKLAIVTCGGPFDPATGHYLDNVIVWATPR